jgi:hypothetical protein
MEADTDHEYSEAIFMDENVKVFMEKVMEKNPGEKEFHQAVQEFAESVMPFI